VQREHLAGLTAGDSRLDTAEVETFHDHHAHHREENAMRPFKIAIPMAKPRNRVVQALVRGLLGARTRVHAPGPRRSRDLARMDLDQRVRETGEW
jgi:hypothetical protein